MSLLERAKSSVQLVRRSGLHYLRRSMIHPPFWLRVNGKVSQVLAADDAGSVNCYAEIVITDCYRLFSYARDARPATIVDIGANLGLFSKLCALLFPDAQIYAYEPNPKALRWLRMNAEGSRIRVFPVAVTDDAETAKLETTCDPTLSRISDEGDLAVECVPASVVAEGREIDLLKLDCEGSEWSILANPGLLRRSKLCCLEYHLFDGHTLDELKKMIALGGHRIVSHDGVKEGGKYGLLRTVRVAGATSPV